MKEEFANLPVKELVAKAIDHELDHDEQMGVKDLLESMYTSMICNCIDRALAKDQQSLVFSDEEKLKIDMGIIADEAYPDDESRQAIKDAWNKRNTFHRIKLLYLSDWLEEFYLNNQDFGINNSKQLESKIKEIENNIFQNQLEIINLQQGIDLSHKQLSDMNGIDSSLKNKVKTYVLSRSLEQLEEKLLNNVLNLKWKQTHGGLTDKEETMNLSKCVLEQSKARTLRNNILEEMKKSYNKPLVAKQLIGLYDEIEKFKTDQFMSIKLKASLIDERNKFDEKLSGFSISQKAEILKNEITRIQVLLRTCGHRGKIMNPSAVHIFKQFVQAQEAITVIDQINEYDPTLFSNPHCERTGLPCILLVPGQGNGLYDIESNCMLLPIFSYNFKESVVDMLADYRLGVDEGDVLMKSFAKEMSPGNKLDSNIRLRGLFKRHYMIWVTKEVLGYKALDRNARKWFETHIAPKNDQIKVPRGLLTLHPGDFDDLKEMLDAGLNENPHSALLHLKLGTILALSEQDLDRSLKCFLQALKLDPQLHDTEYNIAQIYMKFGRKREAVAYFQKYSSHNYHNWWTAIAQRWIQIMER